MINIQKIITHILCTTAAYLFLQCSVTCLVGLVCDVVDNGVTVFTEHPEPAQRSFHSETVSQFRSVR